MSADNGYVLRKNQHGMYCLQHYFDSAGFPRIENTPANMQFQTLEAAMKWFEEKGGDTEYGLRVIITITTYDHTHRLESWGWNGDQRCEFPGCPLTIDRNGAIIQGL